VTFRVVIVDLYTERNVQPAQQWTLTAYAVSSWMLRAGTDLALMQRFTTIAIVVLGSILPFKSSIGKSAVG